VRHKPSLKYSGLTVILESPSRFDKGSLISGYAGHLFQNALGIPRQSCDIRLLNTLGEGFLPDTKVILLLGEKALKTFKNSKLGGQRGCPWMVHGRTYIATFAPQNAIDRKAYFNPLAHETEYDYDETERHGKTKRSNWRYWMQRDVSKAAGYLKTPPNPIEGESDIYPKASEVIDLLTNTKGKDMFFDIETNPSLEMTCFGFSFGGKGYCVPMLRINYYHYDETHQILRALAVAFRDNTVVIHNALFDLFVVAYRYGIPAPRKVYDTMLAHHRLFPEIEKSLGHCISLYTDQPYHKNEGCYNPQNAEQFDQLYHYNVKDVLTMALIKPSIDELAVTMGATKSIEQANSMVVPYLTAMCQGLRINTAEKKKILMRNERHKNQLRRMLSLLVGHDLNPNSPKQVSVYLYDRMKLKKPAKDLTNEKTLLQHRLKYDLPAISIILKYRSIAKESGQLKYNPYDGLHNKPMVDRITTSYNLAGTSTFRLASRKLLGRWGTNIQNIPKKLRHLFIADEGKVLVQADQAGAEAMIVGYLCTQGNFRTLFLEGIKSHVFVAMRLFPDVWSAELGRSIDEFCEAPIHELKDIKGWDELNSVIKDSDNWTADKRYYFMAKMVCHASNYGMKAPTFRTNILQKSQGAIALESKEAKRFLSTYHKLFPEINQWHNETVERLKETRTLKNLFGYPRYFTGIIDESMYKEAYAFVPQSTVGCITNLAFVELQNRQDLQELGVDVLQNNHDSVLLQCAPEHSEFVAQEAMKHLNREMISPRGERFSMRSEAMIGDNWKEMIDV